MLLLEIPVILFKVQIKRDVVRNNSTRIKRNARVTANLVARVTLMFCC